MKNKKGNTNKFGSSRKIVKIDYYDLKMRRNRSECACKTTGMGMQNDTVEH